MTTRLPQDQVDLLQRAADALDREAHMFSENSQKQDHATANILRWLADPESAGPVLHDSALAIARAVLGEEA